MRHNRCHACHRGPPPRTRKSSLNSTPTCAPTHWCAQLNWPASVDAAAVPELANPATVRGREPAASGEHPPHLCSHGQFPSRFSGPFLQGCQESFTATPDIPSSFSPGVRNAPFSHGRCNPRPERGLKSGCSLFPVGSALPRLCLRVPVPLRLLTKLPNSLYTVMTTQKTPFG